MKLISVKATDKTGHACAGMLRKWAALGSLHYNAELPRPSWKPIEGIIKASRDKLNEDAERLRRLLDSSTRRLSPLGDPLSEDFGTHRWLKGKREETYSDWLAWVLEQLRDFDRISKIFNVKSSQKHFSGDLSVKREEKSVTEGGSDQSGRMDLVVQFGDRWAMIIEVKLDSAEKADTKKQKKYVRSRKAKSASKVLLALSGERAKYEGGFILRKWEDVCVEFRRMMTDSGADLSLIQKAMILSFIGAIEQNILKFPGQLMVKLRDGYGMSSALEDYLRRSSYDKTNCS